MHRSGFEMCVSGVEGTATRNSLSVCLSVSAPSRVAQMEGRSPVGWVATGTAVILIINIVSAVA
jgi:hypothetical protein